MEVHVNWLAVVLATVSSMIVGAIWYTPSVFGNAWMRLVGIKPKKGAKMGAKPILIALAASFLSAFVLAHVTYMANMFYGNSFLVAAVTTAFWMWLGFTVARLITHDVFEGRPKALTALNLAHELVTLLVMSAVIGALGV